MAANSKIEWTSHTLNPWIGCTKVHTGCLHCYAETFSKWTGKATWGPNGTRSLTSKSNWQQPVKWNRDAECLRTFDCANGDHSDACPQKVRPRVFCASLADVFEDWSGKMLNHKKEVLYTCPKCGCCDDDFQDGSGHWEKGTSQAHLDEPGWSYWTLACNRCEEISDMRESTMQDVRIELFKLIDATPNLDWLLLTKRPENIGRMWPLPQNGRDPGDPHVARRENVWLGTSISDQKTADKAIPELLKCRDLSPVLFLSAEPLVGPIDLPLCFHSSDDPNQHDHSGCAPIPDWVIVGGESGHGARVCNSEWIHSIREQCQAAGVPCFIKQLGAEPRPGPRTSDVLVRAMKDDKGGDWSEWPISLRVRQFPEVKA